MFERFRRKKIWVVCIEDDEGHFAELQPDGTIFTSTPFRLIGVSHSVVEVETQVRELQQLNKHIIIVNPDDSFTHILPINISAENNCWNKLALAAVQRERSLLHGAVS
jgi:hypothetical protein